MIQIGKKPEEEPRLYTFSQAAEIMSIKQNGKLIGRTKIMEILRKCNVLDFGNKPNVRFVDEGYLLSKTKIHAPRNKWRRDPVTLIVGRRGLEFIKKIVENYIANPVRPTFAYQTKISFKPLTHPTERDIFI